MRVGLSFGIGPLRFYQPLFRSRRRGGWSSGMGRARSGTGRLVLPTAAVVGGERRER